LTNCNLFRKLKQPKDEKQKATEWSGKPKFGGNCGFCQNTVFCKPIHKKDALLYRATIPNGEPKCFLCVNFNKNTCAKLNPSTCAEPVEAKNPPTPRKIFLYSNRQPKPGAEK